MARQSVHAPRVFTGRSSRIGCRLVALALLLPVTTADAAGELTAPTGRPIGLPAQAGRLDSCPPGQLAYKSSADGLVNCIAASAFGPEQSRNAGTGELRQQLQALLPSLRIDDGAMQRALVPVAWTVCRSIGVHWTGPREVTPDAATDGSLAIVGETRCREPYDVRASARLGSGGLVSIATDSNGALLWWRQMPDIRRVHPALFPSTGDEHVDRQNRRQHADGIRVGFSRFSIEIPGDRRIARLLVIEATRHEGTRAPLLLGSIAVPAP